MLGTVGVESVVEAEGVRGKVGMNEAKWEGGGGRKEGMVDVERGVFLIAEFLFLGL